MTGTHSFSIRSEVVLAKKPFEEKHELTPHANRQKGNKIMRLGRRDHRLVVCVHAHVCHAHTHTHVRVCMSMCTEANGIWRILTRGGMLLGKRKEDKEAFRPVLVFKPLKMLS